MFTTKKILFPYLLHWHYIRQATYKSLNIFFFNEFFLMLTYSCHWSFSITSGYLTFLGGLERAIVIE